MKEVYKGLAPPIPKPSRRTILDELIAIAVGMEVGDAVALSMSEAQQMRIILLAQGFECASDGWRGREIGRTDNKRTILVFKLPKVT